LSRLYLTMKVLFGTTKIGWKVDVEVMDKPISIYEII